MIPLTYAVTLADWTPKQDMLRMMLGSLEAQTCKDFDVVLADHHYNARKDAVEELRDKCSFKIHHVPIIPAPHVAKHYIDCSVFNVGWLLSDAERCVRYSEWRFLHPSITEVILSEPKDMFLDFYFHDILETDIWDRESGTINFDNAERFDCPRQSFETVQLNCYANNSLARDLWVGVNGFNEVDFNFFHWEDIDYNARCRHAGYRSKRIPNLMWRMWHEYGPLDNRTTRECEKPVKPICTSCNALIDYIRGHIGTPTHQEWAEMFRGRQSQVKVIFKNGREWIACNKCNFVLPVLDTEDIATFVDRNKDYIKAPINISGSGRNLEPLVEDLKGKSLKTKIEIYEDSWTNERYL